MIVKYIIGLIIGYIVSIGLSILITVLRFGIPECKNRLRDETDELTILALKLLKKRYIISTIPWIIIISVISIGCYFWLQNAIIGYVIGILLNIVNVIKLSNKNMNNLSEFENSLKSNIHYIINSNSQGNTNNILSNDNNLINNTEKEITYTATNMYCRNCGTELLADDNFCVKCGKKLIKTINDNKKDDNINKILLYIFLTLLVVLATLLIICLNY